MCTILHSTLAQGLSGVAACVLGLLGFAPAARAGSEIPLSPAAQAAGAQISFDQGIEFVTVGAPGNAPLGRTAPVGFVDSAIGRGSVGYAYRMGRFEVTTAQWAEFMTAAKDRPSTDRIPMVRLPFSWGASAATGVNGGTRFTVPAGNDFLPTGGIDWRTAAIYCNWLHNNKSTDRAAFLSGAYDVSTFGFDDNGFTDQLSRSPGARYWIPNLDEWLKASHFDPNKSGPGQPGWWLYSITSDTQPTYAPPGVQGVGGRWGTGLGQANSGWTAELGPYTANPFAIPLGAYPTAQSPWGLLDAAGATREWTESFGGAAGLREFRFLDGSAWLDNDPRITDSTFAIPGTFPTDFDLAHGLRIASLVPSPPVLVIVWISSAVVCIRRRR